jgi:hypothetical protein
VLDRAKILPDILKCIVLYLIKILRHPSSGKHNNTGQKVLYKFCYLLPFDLWTSYLEMIFFLMIQRYPTTYFWEFSSSTKIFNRQQHSFQI